MNGLTANNRTLATAYSWRFAGREASKSPGPTAGIDITTSFRDLGARDLSCDDIARFVLSRNN